MNKVKIGGHIFNIKYEKLEKDLAFIDWNTNTITIAEDIPKSQQEASLIHEAMHAMCSSFDGDFGHAFMDSLSQQLYQFLKDNKICFCQNCKESENS